MILVLAVLASFVPSILIYLFMKNKMAKTDVEYKECCKKALIKGFLCALFVTLLSMVFAVIGGLLHLKDGNVILYEFYKDFIIAALAEEIVKYLSLKSLLKKEIKAYSRLDIICFMTIIGLGFGLIEDVLYALNTSPGQILVRGITAMHGGFGFIMGCYVAKAEYTGKKGYKVWGFILPFLLHGIYDFTLTPELQEVSDFFIFPPVLIAAAMLIILIWMIFFLRKARTKEESTALLTESEKIA